MKASSSVGHVGAGIPHGAGTGVTAASSTGQRDIGPSSGAAAGSSLPSSAPSGAGVGVGQGVPLHPAVSSSSSSHKKQTPNKEFMSPTRQSLLGGTGRGLNDSDSDG